MSKRIEIQYDGTILRSSAMSKSPNQSGIAFTKDNGIVKVNALNPKTGETTYLEMQIPTTKIEEVISALKNLINE